MIVVIGVLVLGGAIAAGLVALGSEPQPAPVPVRATNRRRNGRSSG